MRKISRGLPLNPETWTLVEEIAVTYKRNPTEVVRMFLEERLALLPEWGLGDDTTGEKIKASLTEGKKKPDSKTRLPKR